MFRWATSTMGDVALQACAAAGLTPSQLAGFIPHQANLRIIDLIAKKLDAPNVVVARDIITSGNTSSASIPIALSKMLERGEISQRRPRPAGRLRCRPDLCRSGHPDALSEGCRGPIVPLSSHPAATAARPAGSIEACPSRPGPGHSVKAAAFEAER